MAEQNGDSREVRAINRIRDLLVLLMIELALLTGGVILAGLQVGPRR